MRNILKKNNLASVDNTDYAISPSLEASTRRAVAAAIGPQNIGKRLHRIVEILNNCTVTTSIGGVKNR